jgi:hypothetical protein
MKSKLHSKLSKITVEKEENFTLLGIVSPKPIYKIAFLLNQKLHLDFVLYNQEHLEFSMPNLPPIYFSENSADWYLFENTFPKKKIKFKDYDYFLIIHPAISEHEIQEVLSKLNEIQDITISSLLEHKKEIVSLFSSIL